MGPVRGLKRKRKLEKKVFGDGESTAVTTEQGSADWWDGFSRRITGLCFSCCYSCLLFCYLLALFSCHFFFFCIAHFASAVLSVKSMFLTSVSLG